MQAEHAGRAVNIAQEHTTSYYAATANEVTNYPRLRGEQTADVCVIGAGFTGISTALTLVERGYDVCVLESNRISWGASGRNGGQVLADAVGGTLERMDIFSSLLGAKIPGVTRFGNMMVSLGMMYYGLKDRM